MTMTMIDMYELSKGRIALCDKLQEDDTSDNNSTSSGSKWLVSSGEEECLHADYRELTNSGKPGFDESSVVLIVDPPTCKEVQDGMIGEIWVSSRSTTAGYYNHTEATNDTFHNQIHEAHSKKGILAIKVGIQFMRTGDLGCFYTTPSSHNTGNGDGARQLYITGRLKDMICINGQKYVYMHRTLTFIPTFSCIT